MMKKPLFDKVLVANRGEIAVRVTRTLQDMGIVVVALASEPDRTAEHVRAADEVIFLPGKTSAETYLQGDKIIALAKERGVQAVHPGYGFLSESADFAQTCAEAGLTFIGPSPPVIREMGDKIRAKALMESAGVPIIPGYSSTISSEDTSSNAIGAVSWNAVAAAAAAIGYPLLVKAAAGGGGKGMRLVQSADGLEAAWAAAAREAQSAFGDARVFLEKYLVRPRHIEFQIFGDHHGNVVHLFERECSIQRRHQKLIEETPSPALTPELRARMAEAALRAARALHYTNAGTVEFILDENGDFYFLEVNTRLQVEHPITEMTVQQDLVRLQVMVAAGLPLPFTQEDIRPAGHAIECRLCAEDPAQGFLPDTGRLAVYRPPEGPFLRLDSGVREGSEVTVHYDPLLAKLIAWGADRDAALSRMSQALSRFAALGVIHNAAFLKRVIDHPAFRAGHTHTHFLEEHPLQADEAETLPAKALPIGALLVGALATQVTDGENRTMTSESILGSGILGKNAPIGSKQGASPWEHGGAWRQWSCRP
jgi:acetyl-CoA carboxylase biotin carboxylase subunit